jgi:hypothetical protein
MHDSSISMYIYDLKDIIMEDGKLDHFYVQEREAIQQGTFQHKFKDYALEKDGVLRYKGKV